MVNYFFDSYVVAELIDGNPKYAKYSNEAFVFTIFNLAEIYWFALREYSEKESEEIYEYFKQFITNISDEVMKDAMKFRKKNKKRDLSYADCIGYIYALKNNLTFLTGDKEFKNLPNVEFIAK